MSKIPVALSLSILFLLSLTIGEAKAKELRVWPSSYSWTEVRTGKTLTMPVPVILNNCSREEATYHLRARVPAEIGVKADRGFTPITDTSWVSFQETLVKVPANGTREVQVYLTVPQAAEFKKPMLFFIEVKEEVMRYGYLRGKPRAVALACYLKVSLSPH